MPILSLFYLCYSSKLLCAPLGRSHFNFHWNPHQNFKFHSKFRFHSQSFSNLKISFQISKWHTIVFPKSILIQHLRFNFTPHSPFPSKFCFAIPNLTQSIFQPTIHHSHEFFYLSSHTNTNLKFPIWNLIINYQLVN